MRIVFHIVYLCLFISSLIIAVHSTSDKEFELIILHNNDMHARFEETNAESGTCTEIDKNTNRCYGGFARVAHVIRKYREEENSPNGTPVLYLNAGDTYTGTTWFNIFKANITAEFLNILLPDAISLGNHEFDEGVEGLIPFLNTAMFPVLASNLDLRKTPELTKTKSLKSTVIIEKKGIKIGIIGYVTPDTKFLAPRNEVEYYNEISSINAEASNLKKDGVNIIIALGHSGFGMDKRIGTDCPDVDLVIGGHTNTFLYNGIKPDLEEIVDSYPVVMQNSGKKQVPVVQAYAFTKYLGKITLKFNDKGKLLHWLGQPILLNSSIPQAEDVLELLEKYRPAIDELKKKILGESTVYLDGRAEVCRLKECNLGNLITDAFIWTNAIQHNGSDGYWTDAPIAFVQSGGIRASIDAKANGGKISQFDVDTVLPFDSTLAKVSLPGSKIKDALEHSVHQYSRVDMFGEFLQMSGIRVLYNLTNAPNHRVVEVDVLCGPCDIPKYSPLEENKIYNVIINSFLLDGGDNFEVFRNTGYNLKIRDADAVIKYIENMHLVYPAIESRIKILDNTTDSSNIIALSFSIIILTLMYHIFLINQYATF